MFAFAAFLVPLLHGITNMLEGHLSKSMTGLYASVFFMRTMTIAGVVVLALVFGIPVPPDATVLFFIAAAAVMATIYIMPFLAAYRYIDTSTTGAISAIGKIFTPTLAFIFLNEKLQLSQYAGFAVIIVFSVLLGLNKKTKLRLNPGFFLMALVAFISAIETILLKHAGEIDWWAATFYFLLIKSLIPYCFLLIKRTRKEIMDALPYYRPNLTIFLSIVFFGMAGSLARVYALSGIYATELSAINSIRPILVLFMGALFAWITGKKVNENLSRKAIIKKMICFAFIILGTWVAIGIF